MPQREFPCHCQLALRVRLVEPEEGSESQPQHVIFRQRQLDWNDRSATSKTSNSIPSSSQRTSSALQIDLYAPTALRRTLCCISNSIHLAPYPAFSTGSLGRTILTALTSRESHCIRFSRLAHRTAPKFHQTSFLASIHFNLPPRKCCAPPDPTHCTELTSHPACRKFQSPPAPTHPRHFHLRNIQPRSTTTTSHTLPSLFTIVNHQDSQSPTPYPSTPLFGTPTPTPPHYHSSYRDYVR